MVFEWSSNGAHIQTLYPSWTLESGYSEDAICALEKNIGIKLPLMLRNFYKSWGRCKGLTDAQEVIFMLEEVKIWNTGLVFCIENQGVFYWAVQQEEMYLDNPPVWYAYNEEVFLGWNLSHTHLSHFLDALAYHQAFSGGARHGAISQNRPTQKQIDLIQHNWRKRDIESVPWGIYPDAYPRPHCWSIYTSPGQAIDIGVFALYVATQNTEDIGEIKQLLDIEWKYTW